MNSIGIDLDILCSALFDYDPDFVEFSAYETLARLKLNTYNSKFIVWKRSCKLNSKKTFSEKEPDLRRTLLRKLLITKNKLFM